MYLDYGMSVIRITPLFRSHLNHGQFCLQFRIKIEHFSWIFWFYLQLIVTIVLYDIEPWSAVLVYNKVHLMSSNKSYCLFFMLPFGHCPSHIFLGICPPFLLGIALTFGYCLFCMLLFGLCPSPAYLYLVLCHDWLGGLLFRSEFSHNSNYFFDFFVGMIESWVKFFKQV